MLEVRGISKTFGDTVALDEVEFTVGDEIMAVLGPSGCGKSTLLRVVAGLEMPDAGIVTWGGEDLAPVPVHQRRFGLMFQDYALFPHRSVAQNVAFGLRMQGRDREETEHRVEQVLSWVGLDGFGHRRIEGLSGGEQQRVALARTLAPEPRLVMLDEPLGALDRMLRERLVAETRDVLVESGTPAIYVTHDHDEARSVAHRVAIMRAGRIVQLGDFSDIVSHPADKWVARFVGTAANPGLNSGL